MSEKGRIEYLIDLLNTRKHVEYRLSKPMTTDESREVSNLKHDVELELMAYSQYEINCVAELLNELIDTERFTEAVRKARKHVLHKQKLQIRPRATDEFQGFFSALMLYIIAAEMKFKGGHDGVFILALLEQLFASDDNKPSGRLS